VFFLLVSEATFHATCEAMLNFRTYLFSGLRTGGPDPVSGAPIVTSFPTLLLWEQSRYEEQEGRHAYVLSLRCKDAMDVHGFSESNSLGT